MSVELNYPFYQELKDSEDVVLGRFSDVKEFVNDDRYVVKEIEQVYDEAFENYIIEREIRPFNNPVRPEMTFDRFVEVVKFSKDLIDNSSSGLSYFVPPYSLVYGNNPDGKERGFIIMRKVEGIDIQNMDHLTVAEIKMLENLISSCLDFFDGTVVVDIRGFSRGYLPDIIMSSFETDSNKPSLRNIMFGHLSGENDAEERIFFVDTAPLLETEGKGSPNFIELEHVLLSFKERGYRFSEEFLSRVSDYAGADRILTQGIIYSSNS